MQGGTRTIVIWALGVVVEAAGLSLTVVALVVRIRAVAHLLVAAVAVLRGHGQSKKGGVR